MDDEQLFRVAMGEADAREQEAVQQWRAESPQHEAQYRGLVEMLLLVSESSGTAAFGAAPSAETLMTQRSAREEASRTGRVRRSLLAIAAVLAVLALGVPLLQRTSIDPLAGVSARVFGGEEFVTEAEPATVGLRDGSVVRLGPQTRLRLEADGRDRVVSLAGRGYFAVTPDPQAPFTIRTDAGLITVLGTRFDVSVNGEDLRLIVVEGSVRLTARGQEIVVRGGQLAQIVKGNLVAPVNVPDPASLLGWVGNFIAFQNTPLRAVAREIEALHGVRMHFSDPLLEDRAVTALFAGRSFDEIAEVICVVANLHCQRRGDVLHVAPGR